jgi:hypothetical protein
MRPRLFVCVLAAAAIVGCASKPAAPPVTRQVPLDASNIVEAQKAGYKIVNEKGTTLYCRKDPQVGSHVRFITTCLTWQEWQQLALESRGNVERISHRRPPPACGPNSPVSC